MTRTVSSLASPDATSARRVHLSDAQTAHFRRLAHEVAASTLRLEMRFRYADNETLDEREWKLARSKEHMRVYKSVSSSVATESLVRLPMTLGLGSLEGTLEDVLYGMHHKTTHEMRSVATFMNHAVADAAVLATIESGTDADPFRHMGIKWRIVQTPGPGTLIKDRDALTLEYMGIDVDASGRKYGFQLMRSVDLQDNVLDKASRAHIVRGHLLFCCIYRQITPTLVGVFSRGVFDLAGELADYLSYFTASEMVLGIAKAFDSAAAKRLTLLALQKQALNVSPDSSGGSGTRRWSTDATAALKGTRTACALCFKKRFVLARSLQRCRLCAKSACAKCCIRASVFALPRTLQVPCCVACVLESRTLLVDPRDPLPEIVLLPR